MKLLYFTDAHIRGTNPTRRVDVFPQSLRAKFLEIVDLAKMHGVDAILFGGDLLDRPDTAAAVVAEFMRLIRMAPCPVYGILGNHDIFGYNPETYNRAMLSLLDASETIRVIRPGETYWVEKDDLKVQITGQEFHAELDRRDPVLDYCVFADGQGGSFHHRSPDADFAIHLTHGMLLDKKFELAGKSTLLDQVVGKTVADVTFGGHYHPGFSKYIVEAGGRYWINPGALARLHNDKSDRKRPVQVVLVELEKGQKPVPTLIPLKCAKPGTEVFPEDVDNEAELKEIALANFMQTVDADGPINVMNEQAAVDVLADRDQIDEEVRTATIDFIGKAKESLAIKGTDDHPSFSKGHTIAEIEIENFQSHAKTHLELTPGMNVIVGATDNGKSGILRALRWVLWNEPRGTDFVRDGMNHCRVSVRFTDGIEVTREVFVGKNNAARHRYLVKVPGMQFEPFEGFGTDVPLEVVQAHGMPKVMLDDEQDIMLNYATQLEGPFLLGMTSPTRAKAIGRNFGVHVLDHAFGDAQKVKNDGTKSRNRIEAEVMVLDGQIAAFGDLEQEEKVLGDVQEHLESINFLLERMDHLLQLKKRREELLMEVAVHNQQIALLAHVAQAEQELTGAQQLLAKVLLADKLANQRRNLANEVDSHTKRLARLERVAQADEAVKVVSTALERATALAKLRHRRKQSQEQMAESERRLVSLAGVAHAESRCSDLSVLTTRMTALSQAAGRRRTLMTEIGVLETRAQVTAGTDIAFSHTESAVTLFQKLTTLQRLQARRSAAAAEIAEHAKMLERYEQGFKTLETEARIVLKQAGQCPFCSSKIDEEHLNTIVNELIGATN